MRLIPITALSIALYATSAIAHNEPPQYNRVHLDESARAEVDNDLLVVVLSAQAEGRDASAPADEVNRLMDWAVNLSRSHPEVKLQTLGYQTHAVYNKDKIRGWRVSQSLRLESRDNRLLGDLVAKLQAQLHVQSLGYEVSDEQRRGHLDELTATAITRFQARAKHIAGALGRTGFRLVNLQINDSRNRPMPLARGMMMEAATADFSVAPATIEAGTQELTVSVSGEIELSED
ncbi:MAG: SIMPL domain-containing protein [Chromatiaceae bacterium]|nr:SIMPL domain-containing protein [Gammaproteobacteria bacterium]MCP5317501.1 SIMPL domain-containing protein [Chromatiaceae bacterium]